MTHWVLQNNSYSEEGWKAPALRTRALANPHRHGVAKPHADLDREPTWVAKLMNLLLNISIISSSTGGTPGETDAYDRNTTIDRVQQALEALITKHVPNDQHVTFKIEIKKPGGALRRMIRGETGVRTTTIQVRLVPTNLGNDRANAIRSCQAAIPVLVTSNIPANHLCSLVIALKGAV